MKECRASRRRIALQLAQIASTGRRTENRLSRIELRRSKLTTEFLRNGLAREDSRNRIRCGQRSFIRCVTMLGFLNPQTSKGSYMKKFRALLVLAVVAGGVAVRI